MVRRLTIGLRYKHQDAWLGGVHYVRNLVSAFGLLPRRIRPKLLIVGGDKAAVADLKAATGYADLDRISRNRLERRPSLWSSIFFHPPGESLDLILMGAPPGLEDRGVQWIPDLQEHRFPEFFPPEELEDRYARNARWLERHRHVMVSSRDVAADVRRYYPGAANRIHVVRFAAFTDLALKGADLAALRAPYDLPARYVHVANQFWRHKNHAVVLEALAELGPGGPAVVFTGREEDYRDPAYGPSVKALAAQLGVEDRVRFLGFLPRADQLAVMQGAFAVLQPSLCEGWSTVVEDAKALGRRVIASDIAVHREQLGAGADVFEPHDAPALAAILRRYRDADPPAPGGDYARARRRFAGDLWRMVLGVERDMRLSRIDRLVINRT